MSRPAARHARRIARRTTSSAVALAFSLAFAALGAPGTARAQETLPPPPRSFTGIVGAGVVTLPTYAGSDEYRVLPMPIVQVEYRGRVYLGGSQNSVAPGIGAYLVRTPALTVDVGLTGTESRSESRGDALAGMGRRSAAAFASTGVAYRLGIVQASAGVAVGLGSDAGSYGTVGMDTELPIAPRWIAGVSTGVTVADARNMAYDFGVSGEQSAARQALLAAGDPRLSGIDVGVYAPDAGLKEARIGGSLARVLTPRSRIVLFAQGSRLSSEAARSPLVRSRTGIVSGLALGYGF
jgi:outer membrane scaffolding protein for murein synthesis (MipA/OmpV family)